MAIAIPNLNSLQPQFSSLQGSSGVNLQGSSPTLQPTATPMPSGTFVGPVMPKATTPLAVKPLPAQPAISVAKVNYANLTNKNGTIVNDLTGQGYPKPENLAADLGISPSQIQWGSIKMAPTAPTGSPATNTGSPATPDLGLGTSQSSYQTTPSGAVVDGHTGSVIQPAGTISPTVPNTIYDNPEYTAALKSYQDLQNPSTDETSTQAELDNITAGLGITKANQSNQPIPMEFITGQQAASEKRALALATPLQQKLALLQAKRTGAVEASKFALDTTEKKLQAQLDAQTAATKAHTPVNVGAGDTLVDPVTGKAIYSAPAAPKTQVVEVNGHQMLVDQNTGRTIMDLGAKDNVTQNDLVTASQVRTLNGTDAAGNAFSSNYINLADFPDAASKASALKWGASHGVTVLNQSEGEKMVSIDNAYTNIDKMSSGLSDLLANTKGLNLTEGLWKSVTGYFGDEGVRSFNAWRTAVINNVQALAGGQGSGLRINQAEIDTALKNDLPIVQGLGADTVASANAKLNRLKDQLDSWRGTVLDKGNISGSGGNNDALDAALNQIGFKSGGGGTPTATMRTDRNNNPTAMTTDVAKNLGLKLGVDYVQGDPFKSGSGTLYTAKLIGDPIATTIKGLDQGGFYTASGKPRWSYIAIPQATWNKMSYNQKVATVQKMYKSEGGSQLASAFQNYLA